MTEIGMPGDPEVPDSVEDQLETVKEVLGLGGKMPPPKVPRDEKKRHSSVCGFRGPRHNRMGGATQHRRNGIG
ncbi:MAG TPA: hypothetical protein VHU91_09470 [Mycobacteriales bacterium]|nr:hypothetical protein [Mycobacteriales bacterium]